MADTEERHDADMSKKLDAIMDSLTRAHSRMDAMEEGDRKEREAREDKARKDAEERERMDRHRKDRFGHRKDGEAHKDYRARHDADEEAMCDAMRKDGADEHKAREDARRARHDAEEAERKEGGESFAKWAQEEEREQAHQHDRGRKDAEEREKEERERREREERDDRARHDAATTRIADLERQIATMSARFQPLTMEERDALARAQARADGVAGLFGRRASAPIPGETSLDYRRRLANEFKQHSPKFREKSLASVDHDWLGMAEEQIYNDAAAAARSSDRAGAGMLIPIQERDEAGRTITRWTGDNMAWMQVFMSPGRVGKILDPRKRAA